MRETEFWVRMEKHLHGAYARVWADQVVLGSLGGRTVTEALDAGGPIHPGWGAGWGHRALPVSEH